MRPESRGALSALAFLAGVGLSLAMALWMFGCGGTAEPIGLSEPIRVRDGVFKLGALPPAPPAIGDVVPGPRILSFDNANAVIQWGQADKVLTGYATTDSYSVALRFADQGSGYWIVPVGAIDPTAD